MAAAETALDRLRATTWALYDAGAVGPVPEVMQLMHRASTNLERWESLAAPECYGHTPARNDRRGSA
jgi:hypothetical protein